MLSTVDGVLLGVVALSTLLGLFRGIVVEVLSLLVWIAGFWLAFRYGAEVEGMFAAQLHDPAARLFAAYAVVFIAAVVVGGIVTWLVGKLVRSVGLGGIDRLFGAVFGLLRGVALACVVVLVLGFTTAPQQPAWSASPLVPVLMPGAEWMRGWLPDAAAQRVRFDATAPADDGAPVEGAAPRTPAADASTDGASQHATQRNESIQDQAPRKEPSRNETPVRRKQRKPG